MKPDQESLTRLAITSAKAKMFEFSVPDDIHIKVREPLDELLLLTVGQLGDLAAAINREEPESVIADLVADLRFGAQYFEDLELSRENPSLSNDLLLFSAAANYLCGMPGNTKVLSAAMSDVPEIGTPGLARHLKWLLDSDLRTDLLAITLAEDNELGLPTQELQAFARSGTLDEEFETKQSAFRVAAYRVGSPEDLLLTDVICAVARLKVRDSVWNALPTYSGLPASAWTSAIRKPGFMTEFWPAQRQIGLAGILRGTSGILELPTGSGKTRTAELVIRSAFLSGRTSLAIIVAPYRALCHEIRGELAESFEGENVRVDEVSDALALDFEMAVIVGERQVAVMTPEKLAYLLRQVPDLQDSIGLLIVDEAHQFDSGSRGVTFELLLTRLRQVLSPESQKVLISAVIGNAKQVGDWFLGDSYVRVTSSRLRSARTSTAFVSWTTTAGRIEYVAADDLDRSQFYVPRVLERHALNLLGRETKARKFPESQGDDLYRTDIATYLGIAVSRNGPVAIYAPSKASVALICRRFVEISTRGYNVSSLAETSDSGEVAKISSLLQRNVGDTDEAASARLGVFGHHAQIPHGVRTAVESSLRDGAIRFVVCTSTLAQGVNLPLKYLIISSFQQGADRLLTRDFQNLIGRVSRPGMQTEGTVFVTDPSVYDDRRLRGGGYAWGNARRYFAATDLEPSSSSLLQIVNPLRIEELDVTIDAMAILSSHVSGTGLVADLEMSADPQYVELRHAVRERIALIASVESFILASEVPSPGEGLSEWSARLARSTFGYQIADEVEKTRLEYVFTTLATRISELVPDEETRAIFGQSLYGAFDSKALLDWLEPQAATLVGLANAEEAFAAFWPLLSSRIRAKVFARCTISAAMSDVGMAWIEGSPYSRMLEILSVAGAKVWAPKKPGSYTPGRMVELGEGAFGFEASLLLGAVSSLFPLIGIDRQSAASRAVNSLQKRIKYGLATDVAVRFYELGFNDRVIAGALAHVYAEFSSQSDGFLSDLRTHGDEFDLVLRPFPAYFRTLGERLWG